MSFGCASVNNDWGRYSIYPIVPGHEIIGRVVSVGPDVTRFKPGDHVGVGCMVDSCQNCAACKQGLEQYCEEGPTLTYDNIDRHDQMRTFGGYSEKIIVREKFVLQIPEGLDLKGVGPLLMCRHHYMVSPPPLESKRRNKRGSHRSGWTRPYGVKIG